MIGLDTNLLVRLLVVDDPRQADVARKFLEDNCMVEDPGFVNVIVLCELAWTLDRSYGFGSHDIANAIDAILHNRILTVENRAHVVSALQRFRIGGAEFSDMLIGEINRAHGCETTATFDRKAAKIDGFTLVH